MSTTDAPINLYLGKAYGDADYDFLLAEFRRRHPAEFERWRAIEKHLFEIRAGPCAYPDQELMSFCKRFIDAKSVDEYGLGVSHAFDVLRGRILRSLIDELVDLNPAPGKPLITEPRTLTDRELGSLADGFNREQPELWAAWHRIEAGQYSGDDPLRDVNISFLAFLRDHCWVQSLTAASRTFLAMRGVVRATSAASGGNPRE